MNIFDFAKKKQAQEKITMLTCYDYTSAKILAQTDIDCILVGDSAAMTMLGFKDTLPATIEMMQLFTKAVYRGAPNKFIVGDLPFLSYRKSLSQSVEAAGCLMQAGASAVKLENATGNLALIQHLIESGIPVMGHLGLTPQSIYTLGGYKVQGKTQDIADRLKKNAFSLQEAGCFALVLECVPTLLAKEITQALHIPTIGIGAGPHTDGQVLVWQDVLGLNMDIKPKFVKAFMNGQRGFKKSITLFTKSVKTGTFPGHENSY